MPAQARNQNLLLSHAHSQEGVRTHGLTQEQIHTDTLTDSPNSEAWDRALTFMTLQMPSSSNQERMWSVFLMGVGCGL